MWILSRILLLSQTSLQYCSYIICHSVGLLLMWSMATSRPQDSPLSCYTIMDNCVPFTSRVVAFRIGNLHWWKNDGSRPHSFATINFVIVVMQCLCCMILFCRHTIHPKKYAYGLCIVMVWFQSSIPISFRITSLAGAILTPLRQGNNPEEYR